MELKKTTVVSALVCIAGVLAEIIFSDTMSRSVFGVVLSIVLALVVLGSAFFVIDGIRSFWLLEREMAREREKEYEERLYGVLNEQLQFEKEIYRGVYATQNRDNLFEEESAVTDNVQDKTSEETIAAINDHTMTAAKTVAKFVNKNTTEVKELMATNQEDVIALLQTIESNQEKLLEIVKKLQ